MPTTRPEIPLTLTGKTVYSACERFLAKMIGVVYDIARSHKYQGYRNTISTICKVFFYDNHTAHRRSEPVDPSMSHCIQHNSP